MNFLLVAQSRSFGSVIGLLVVFCVVIAGSYFLTYYVAKFQKGVQQQKNLQVIEAISVGQAKNLQLVRMGNKYAVIGITRGNIQLLMTLEKEDVLLSSDKDQSSVIPFKQILSKYKLDKDKESTRDYNEQQETQDDKK